MEAKELRIGNLVNHGKAYQNRYKNPNEISWMDLEDTSGYEPIPLTEECGFELEDKYWNFVGYGTRLIYQDRLHPAIKIEKLKTQWVFYFNDEIINFKEYLHEAQNLYFALTNEELKLNL